MDSPKVGASSLSWADGKGEAWIGLACCVGVAVGWVLQLLDSSRPTYAQVFGPNVLPLVAAGIAAVAILPLDGSPRGLRARSVLRWSGLLLLIWAANGLPLDIFRVVGLIPLPVDWPGLATRGFALAGAAVLARPILTDPVVPPSKSPALWYGFAAFVLAMPYPILRTHWALGGMLGLQWPGAAGEGLAAWVFCIPWLVAAGLSLFLVSPPHWMPRRLLLAGGWTATGIVAMIGPAACWALLAGLVNGSDSGMLGIDLWVPALFYVSWFLWAIVAALATRSYQVRSAAACRPQTPCPRGGASPR